MADIGSTVHFLTVDVVGSIRPRKAQIDKSSVTVSIEKTVLDSLLYTQGSAILFGMSSRVMRGLDFSHGTPQALAADLLENKGLARLGFRGRNVGTKSEGPFASTCHCEHSSLPALILI
jgi:hypothetical protein